jgi:hypothetical protein
MSADPRATQLLDQAAGHLLAAAERADALAGDDPFSDWDDLASQARLTASGVSHSPLPPTDLDASIAEALSAALLILDTIPVEDGPPDLLLWAWHIRELHDLADGMERR